MNVEKEEVLAVMTKHQRRAYWWAYICFFVAAADLAYGIHASSLLMLFFAAWMFYHGQKIFEIAKSYDPLIKELS